MADNQQSEFNSEKQQQIEQYKTAFDNLRNSISGLEKPLTAISNSINSLDKDLSKFTDTVSKLNAQNAALSASSDKIKTNLTDVSSSFSTWTGIVGLATKSLGGWGIALSATLTILTVYGDGLLKWIDNMVKGTTTLSALGKVMKDNAIIANSLIQVKLQTAKAAQTEITDLNILYKATQDRNLLLTQQKAAVRALKDQWPGTFKNISDETIMAGKAAYAYKNLKDQIMATAYAEAAKNKIVENAGRVLENDQKIAKERANNLKIIAQQKKAEKEHNDYLNSTQKDAHNNEYAAIKKYDNNPKLDEISNQRAASDKIIYDLSTDTDLLNKQNDQFYNEIEKRVKLFGVSITGHNDVINRTAISSQNKQSKPQPADNKQRDPVENLQAMSLNFSKTIELEKKNYDTEQALLNEQLNRKLLSQQQYQEKSEQLLETYHQNIGVNVKNFQDVNLADAQKNIQDAVNANQHEATTKKDQHDVDTAILPDSKLAAEKKQLVDKYDYEITLATGNADTIKQLEQQKQTDITVLSKKYEQERQDFELQTAQKVSNAAFTILQNSIKSQSNSKIKQLESQKQAELNNTTLTGTQRQAIEAKYKKKENEQKVKAFKDEQKASILQAVINGALAVTKATAQSGMLSAFVIPVIIAETAIQVATIAAQKPPQYAKGGLHYQSDGKGALLSGYSRTDNTNAYLRSGEAVVVSEAMRDPWARNLVSAINVAYGGRDFSSTSRGNAYAIGGIFTDGGNSNRYYNQPMNDQKDLANTIAYQMINNFPPVYVDVKDINNQQNILAQTVNRVNL